MGRSARRRRVEQLTLHSALGTEPATQLRVLDQLAAAEPEDQVPDGVELLAEMLGYDLGEHAFRQALLRLAEGFPLEALEAVREARAALDALAIDGVDRAREAGCSWALIAAALGVTRQSAHERYGRTGA